MIALRRYKRAPDVAAQSRTAGAKGRYAIGVVYAVGRMAFNFVSAVRMAARTTIEPV